MFGISALKTSIPSVLRRPKICSVLRDFICENELNRKHAVSMKHWMDEASVHLFANLPSKQAHIWGEHVSAVKHFCTRLWIILLSSSTADAWVKGEHACKLLLGIPLVLMIISYNLCKTKVLGRLAMLFLPLAQMFSFDWEGISNTLDSVWPHFQFT